MKHIKTYRSNLRECQVIMNVSLKGNLWFAYVANANRDTVDYCRLIRILFNHRDNERSV